VNMGKSAHYPGEIFGTPSENRELSVFECFALYNSDKDGFDKVLDTIKKEYSKPEYVVNGKKPLGCKMDVLVRQPRNPMTDVIARTNARTIQLAMAKKKGVLER
jgi:hypothetical protein